MQCSYSELAYFALAALVAGACNGGDDISSVQHAAGNGVRSQLRGYDLGPPFPAGFRDSGLINGYDEGEWIPFVAAIEGRKLEKADANEGGTGDGTYRATIIIPTYSPRQEANGISDLAVTGTYGQGDLTPIPSPFDDRWLLDNGYAPFVLGAYSDSEIDVQPQITGIGQRSGPTRFGGDVASVAVTVSFVSGADADRVELRFAIRLAPPGLAPIGPGGQAFPGGESGAAAGAGSFHPGPGPLLAGYEVGDPTGIATVPIKVEHNDCDGDDDCVPGEFCSAGGDCEEPCASDADCPTEEICEDSVCVPPPPPCEEDADCNGDYCVGGFCLPIDDPTPCQSQYDCGGGALCEGGYCEPTDSPDECTTGDDCPPNSEDTAADASAPAADAVPVTDAGPPADADYSSSPFLLIICAADEAEPGVDAGSLDGGVADAGPTPGVDDPCCDPTGMCPGGLACIQGPTPEEHRCRARCDLAVRECAAGGVCADFGGEGVCIPASSEGLDCAPELCDSATICVGSSADDATCWRRCEVDEDCDVGQFCTNLTQTDVKACQ